MKEKWKRSSKFIVIDKEMVNKLLEPVFDNFRLIDLQPLTGGLVNSNYRIRIEKKSKVINIFLLRIYPNPEKVHFGDVTADSVCLKEKDILRLVKSKIPVPKCIFASVEENSKNPTFMLQSWIYGDSLKKFLQSSSSASQKMTIATSIGKTLANIHSFKFEKPGILGPELKIVDPLNINPESFMNYMEQFLINGYAGKRLNQVQKEAIWNWTGKTVDLLHFTSQVPCLVHGDFNPSNIFISGDASNKLTISGILDWEFALSGSNLFDFGNLFRYERDLESPFVKKIILSYHQHGEDLPNDWQTLIRLIDLLSICSMLNREKCDPIMEKDLKSVIDFYTKFG